MVYKELGKSFFPFLLVLSEVNDNLGEHHFGGMKTVRPILECRRLLYRDLINNPYLKQDYMTLEERNRNIKRKNYGHILIKLPTGKTPMATKSSDQNQNIPLTTATVGFSY